MSSLIVLMGTQIFVIPSNEYIISASFEIIIWKPNYKNKYQNMAKLIGHTNSIMSLVISPSNQNIISASYDKTIKVWNSKSFELIATLPGHNYGISSLAIPFLSQYLLSGSFQEMKIWDMQLLECVETLNESVSHVKSLNFLGFNIID